MGNEVIDLTEIADYQLSWLAVLNAMTKFQVSQK